MLQLSVKHIFLLRLIACYHFRSERSLQNLLFLAAAEKSEPQQMGIYDYVRTRKGAHSRTVKRILDELKEEGLINDVQELSLTDEGKKFYTNMGASLNPFFGFWNLCVDVIERYGGDPEKLNKRVFYSLAFRRARLGEPIFTNFIG